MSEYLFGLVWAFITVLFVVFILGLDFVPEQPDYFIGVQK